MKRTLFILTIVLLLTPMSAVAAIEPQARKLTLQECISIALKNATQVKKAENNLRLEGADLLKSYGSFLPKVSATAGYVPRSVNRSYSSSISGSLYGDKVKTESESVNLGVTASLNIFNGLSDYAALRSAIDLKHAAGLSLQRARESIVFDITQHYYQALLDRELLGIARENLNSSSDLLTLTDRQYQIGLKSLTDLYQQQAEVASNSLTAIKADNQARKSVSELLRRLRIDPMTPIDIEPIDTSSSSPVRVSVDADSLTTLSMKRRADLEAGRLETDAARWQVRKAAGNRLPKLDLAFSASSDGTNFLKYNGTDYTSYYPPLSTQLENGVGYMVSLNLNWSIFDGFLTRYSVESAKVALLNRRLDYEELKDGVVLDIRQTAADYRAAFTQLEAAKASLRAASSAFSAVQRKYELGASGFVELSAARATLFNAKSGLTQAAYNLALQKALLDYTSGKAVSE